MNNHLRRFAAHSHTRTLTISRPSAVLPISRLSFRSNQPRNRYYSTPTSSNRLGFMGDNIINFYAGAPPLNRLSFHRNSTEKMTAHLEAPTAKFLIFKDGKPLMKLKSDLPDTHSGWAPSSEKVFGEMYLASREEVVEGSLLGGEGGGSVFATSGPSPDILPKFLESARLPTSSSSSASTSSTLPILVFLGIDDRPSPIAPNATPAKVNPQNPEGVPYFAIDVSLPSLSSQLSTFLSNSSKEEKLEFQDARTAASTLSPWSANLFATARALVDWNSRNKFCPACGKGTYSLWSGWKRSCVTALEGGDGGCSSLKGVQNTSYPRTDPVIIMGILNDSGDSILLGRQKAWPKGMYSCLAGFIEPGETFEDAVRREVMEEAGIEVGDVRYCSSQPWPYPSNLMVGCYGQALNSAKQSIDLTLDNELEHARWFTRSEIKEILSRPNGTNISRTEAKKVTDTADALAPAEGTVPADKDEVDKKPDIRVPPTTAIAGVLIKHWVEGGIDATGGLKASL